MVYQAIKSQSEKGPTDAVTGDAYFSLDSSRLLRDDVEFKEIVMHFTMIIMSGKPAMESRGGGGLL